VLYVYAIADSFSVATKTGLQGARLRAIDCGRVRAVVSEHRVAPEPDEELLWAHERILEELMQGSTILPMRFGSTVPGVEALEAALEGREKEFVASLQRVRGAVELSVRAQLPTLAEPSDVALQPTLERSGPGTAYLIGRARQQRQGEEVAELVHGPLAGLARRSVSKLGRGDPWVLKAAYLVDEEAVAVFADRVGRLSDSLEELRVSCTGPWPAYSFVSEEPA